MATRSVLHLEHFSLAWAFAVAAVLSTANSQSPLTIPECAALKDLFATVGCATDTTFYCNTTCLPDPSSPNTYIYPTCSTTNPTSVGGLSIAGYPKQLNASIVGLFDIVFFRATAINGSLPDQIGQLGNLQYISISNSDLSGSIPAALSGLQNLNTLELRNNKLVGSLPWQMSSLSSLTALNLADNSLSGTIPASWSHLNGLQQLVLTNNQLNGSIPSWVDSNANLTTSDLRNNFFTSLADPNTCTTNAHLLVSGNCLPSNSSCSSYNRPSSDCTQFLGNGTQPGGGDGQGHSNNYILFVVLGVLGALLLLFVVLGVVFRRTVLGWFRRGREQGSRQGPLLDVAQLNTSVPTRSFPLCKILAATDDFGDDNLLASGGFGEVFKGVLPQDCGLYAGRDVAIKRIKVGETTSTNEAFIESFKKEVEVLLGLDHVNVVKLLGYCCEGKERLLVFQFAERGSLMSLLKKERAKPALPSSTAEVCPGESLTWERRLKLAEGAARGLKYLHFDRNEPILHLDVKSDNILVTSDYTAKVADFGLSKSSVLTKDPTELSLATIHHKGTIGYMDPSFSIDFILDRSSDVYSFGIVLLEIATDKHPTGFQVDGTHRALALGIAMEVNENGFQSVAAPAAAASLGQSSWGLFKRLLCLGLWCSVFDRSLRPSMETVLAVLHQIALGEDGPGQESCVMETPNESTLREGLWSLLGANDRPPGNDLPSWVTSDSKSSAHSH